MDQVSAPLAEMISLSKSYGGVEAARNVDVTVRPGEVHAMRGEHGAGKSTLMKILSGEVGGHRGEIRIGGAPVKLARPLDAQRAGVAMISQELDLVPALSMPQNIFLSREPMTAFGTLDRRRMLRETRSLQARTGVVLGADRFVERLRTGERQLATIAKALSFDACILIMDEPTSALSGHEVEQLFRAIGEQTGRSSIRAAPDNR
jgi:ribose transport system ATP-binding protein